jgi:putative addiction module CopG family antidote
MEVALNEHWKAFIRKLIGSGRYSNASDVVRAALQDLEEKEMAVYPPGSLKHLYTEAANDEETELARRVRVPEPEEI